MTDTEAISILDAATQPQAVGKVTRQGYAQIDEAIQHIMDRMKDLAALEAKKEPDAAGPGQ